jgi:hypothetical protein
VTQGPANATVTVGQTATFTAAASGTPSPAVQWESSTDGATWTSVAGANTTTLSFAAAPSDNGTQYRAVFTNTAGSATTSAATLTVQTAPAVTSSPSSSSLTEGQVASFTAAASGNPTPAVQWQVSTDEGATFTDISGANSTTLSLTTTLAMNGNQYRAVFTNATGSATTTAATLSVALAATVPGAPSVPTVSVPVTGSVALSWSPPASDGGSQITTYQVESSKDGGAWGTATTTSGVTSASLSALPAGSYSFRVVAINGVGPSDPSVGSPAIYPDVTSPVAGTPKLTSPSVTVAGFYVAPVSVTWGWSDAYSGIDPANCPATTVVQNVQGSVPVTSSCTDRAGNTASASTTVKIDMVGPASAPTQSPAANAAGWTKGTSVTVSWKWSEPTGASGLTTASTTNCPASTKITTPGPTTLSASCKDKAGNTTVATYSVKYDNSLPTYVAAASPTPNAAGWNNSAVTVTWHWADALSGLDPTSCPTTTTSSTNGVRNITAVCKDVAGSSVTGTYAVKVDTVKPTETLTLSSTVVALNAPSPASATASDATSGLAAPPLCSAPTNALGLFTATCTVSDNAGNTTTKTGTYRVADAVLGFGTTPTSTTAGAKSVQVGYTLGSYDGLTTDATATTRVQLVTATGTALATVTAPWSATLNQYSAKLTRPSTAVVGTTYYLRVQQQIGTTWVTSPNPASGTVNKQPIVFN